MATKLHPLSKTKKFKSNFLSDDKFSIQPLLDKIYGLHSKLFDNSSKLAKRPIKRFKYENELTTDFFTNNGLSQKQLMNELKQVFDGAINWQNPCTAFNITSTPLFDTVAASTIATLMNPNCLWDLTSGKFVLTEKKIINLFGKKVFHSNISDGFSTFGGKGTLLYAIKTGLSNCDLRHKKEGLDGKYVAICSYASHFCIADVCDYVGIGTNALLKIPLLPSGEMNYSILEETLEKSIKEGKKIATVVCNGGTTIDFCMDNAKKIRSITDKLEKKYNLPYKIHIHGDMVFGWAWFFADEEYLKQSGTIAAKKILKIKTMLKNMKYTDSIGVDFHKMGLCPYNSSFFILKDKQKMNLLGGAVTALDDGLWGTKHPHYHSIENSKSGAGIISAYSALCTLGSCGIADYLLYLMNVKETYIALIKDKFKHIFHIINSKSLGFEIVFTVSVNGHNFTKEDYLRLCNNIWYSTRSPYMISQVSRYFRNGKPEPAVLLYSMSPHTTDKHCLDVLKMLEADCYNIAESEQHNGYKDNNNVFIPK